MTKVRVFPNDILFVVLQDSTVHFLIRDSLKVAYTANLSYGQSFDSGDHSPVKQNKISIRLVENAPDNVLVIPLNFHL